MHHLREPPKHRVIEGTGGEGELGGLLDHRLDDGGVAVALVHRRVGGEHVDVLLAFDVPYFRALATVKDDREGVVAVFRGFGVSIWRMSHWALKVCNSRWQKVEAQGSQAKDGWSKRKDRFCQGGR